MIWVSIPTWPLGELCWTVSNELGDDMRHEVDAVEILLLYMTADADIVGLDLRAADAGLGEYTLLDFAVDIVHSVVDVGMSADIEEQSCVVGVPAHTGACSSRDVLVLEIVNDASSAARIAAAAAYRTRHLDADNLDVDNIVAIL